MARIRALCACVLAMLGLSLTGSANPVLVRPYPIPDLVLLCGGPNQPCCRHPTQEQLPGGAGPPVNCKGELGCDLRTNTCVAPCGGAGQVCCDGPGVRAPRWDAQGRVWVPAGMVREMCDRGSVCDSATRICTAQCGRRAGDACCPAQPGVATAMCTGPSLTCDFAPGTGYAPGTCAACGGQGQLACTQGPACERGLVEDPASGRCTFCGGEGQPVCEGTSPCHGDLAPRPIAHDVCVAAGRPGQPCMPGRRCHQGADCNARNMCTGCGGYGEACCTQSSPFQCLDGTCNAGRCPTRCGYLDTPQCPSGQACKQGVAHGGFCRACGGEGQPCCVDMVRKCDDGLQCRDGGCKRVGGTPPGGTARTCGGQPYEITTQVRPVFFEDDAQCPQVHGFPSNSEAEALQCAQGLVGDRVIGLYPPSFRVYYQCPLVGCTSRVLVARDYEAAKSCIESEGCDVLEMPCQ